MAIVTQTLVDTFAAKLVSKLSFITVGGQKAEVEGKGTDKEVTLRVIDPTHTVASDTSTVGSNSNTINLGELNQKKVVVPMAHYYGGFKASVVDLAVSVKDPELQKHIDAEVKDMVAKIRKDAIKNVFKPNKAYVGGWEDVETASGVISDEVEGGVFGFINVKAKSKLSVSQPFGSQVGEKLYRASEIGQGKDGSYFYNEKSMPSVVIASDDTFASASVTVSNGVITALTITGTTGTQTLPKGTPVTLKGVKACDGLGNASDEDAVIILTEDVTPASKVYTLTGKFEAPTLVGAGRQICDDDGTDLASGDVAGASIPAAGTYYIGFLKCQDANAYASCPVKSKKAEYKEANVDGIIVSINSVSDDTKVDIVDGYRFDCYLCQGVIDPRLTALVYIKK